MGNSSTACQDSCRRHGLTPRPASCGMCDATSEFGCTGYRGDVCHLVRAYTAQRDSGIANRMPNALHTCKCPKTRRKASKRKGAIFLDRIVCLRMQQFLLRYGARVHALLSKASGRIMLLPNWTLSVAVRLPNPRSHYAPIHAPYLRLLQPT